MKIKLSCKKCKFKDWLFDFKTKKTKTTYETINQRRVLNNWREIDHPRILVSTDIRVQIQLERTT
jgi:hypothetical protein